MVEEAIHTVLSTVDLATVLERTARLLRRHFGDTRVAINRVVEGKLAEVILLDDPRFPRDELGTRFPLEGSAAGQAVATRKPFVLDPIDSVTPRLREERLLAPYGYASLVSFPLAFEDQVLGTLDIAHMPNEGLLACCFKTAEQVARLVGMALHNSLMVEEVRRLNRLLDRENTMLRDELRQIRRESRYVAESPVMREVMERLRLVVPSETTVLIRGETGTGKEGLARMVHELGPRFGNPFVVVNLGAIAPGLIESELFGHEKGAFTGATHRQSGRFEQAQGGTLFLDEVGDAPSAVQVRLLRVLQEREIQRVGGQERIPVNVRVVAATNRPLESMVAEGAFRSDLYYRLNIFPLNLPPLRERREDIRPLAAYLAGRTAATMHRRPPRISDAVVRVLESYDWPGNIRELANFIERSLILSPGPELVLRELPGERTSLAPRSRAEGGVRRFEDGVRELLRAALAAAGGKVYGAGGAAALLGLKPTTLQGKLRKYGVKAEA